MKIKPQLEQIIKEVCAHINKNTKALMIRNTYHITVDTPKWTDCGLARDSGANDGDYGMYEMSFGVEREVPDFVIRVRRSFATDSCYVEAVIPAVGQELAKELAGYQKHKPQGVLANIDEINADLVAVLVRHYPILKLAGKRYAEPLSDCEDDS